MCVGLLQNKVQVLVLEPVKKTNKKKWKKLNACSGTLPLLFVVKLFFLYLKIYMTYLYILNHYKMNRTRGEPKEIQEIRAPTKVSITPSRTV